MSSARDRADWIERCRLANLDDDQVLLLESVLATTDPKAVLTGHVAGARTAVATIAQAHAALESRGRPGRRQAQPHSGWAFRLVSSASAALTSAKSVFPPGLLDSAAKTLQSIEAAGEAGLVDRADCQAAAALLTTLTNDVRTAVTDGFKAVWNGVAVAGAVELISLELSALCLLSGRSPSQLNADLRRELSGGMVSADRVLQVLLPAERNFEVVVVVEGASKLESMAGFMGAAAKLTEISPGAMLSDQSYHATHLRELADLAEKVSAARRAWSGDQASGHVLLAFTVRALDLDGAAALGRRKAAQSLDQYVAGQRIAEIRLRPETLAFDPASGRTRRSAMPVLGAGRVRPLTTSWPAALRESLRTAHIARVTEAPMTAAGLCWVALEALEMKPSDTVKLARALSLQATRQQVLDLHQQVHTAVAALVRAARQAVRAAEETAGHLEAAAGRGAPALAEKAATARADAVARRAALDQAHEAEAQWKAIAAWTGAREGRLSDPNRWLDVLASPPGAEPCLRTAANYLAKLAKHFGGHVGARLLAWRRMLAAPASLADWIEEIAEQFEAKLNWMYVLRNTALHDGQFEFASDVLDAHTGRTFLDLTLEFLGNWYEQSITAATDRAAWSAISVIGHLAERQQEVAAELRRGTHDRLNATHLTSPTSTGWDRK